MLTALAKLAPRRQLRPEPHLDRELLARGHRARRPEVAGERDGAARDPGHRGVGAALANPLAPTIDVPIIAAAAPVAAMNVLVLDIAPLSVLWFMPRREAGTGHSRGMFIPSGNLQERGACQIVTIFQEWRPGAGIGGPPGGAAAGRDDGAGWERRP